MDKTCYESLYRMIIGQNMYNVSKVDKICRSCDKMDKTCHESQYRMIIGQNMYIYIICLLNMVTFQIYYKVTGRP